MRTYVGTRDPDDGCAVTVDGRPLEPRHDLRNHSPDGFEWSYSAGGPAQLALALLADHLGDDDGALDLYQRFKFAVIVRLPYPGWTLTTDAVADALARLVSTN